LFRTFHLKDIYLIESLLTLITTTALLLGSPGPAPLALAATGATYGFKKGVPFLLGILAGLSIAIFGASVGLAALFSTFPSVKVAFQIIGALYIGYIAFKIATAPTLASNTTNNAPRFRDGFILNLLNPKAYAAFLAIFSQFLLPFDQIQTSYAITSIICLIVATVVDVLWLAMGGVLRPVFSKPTQARFIRTVFAVLMVAAVIYTLV
jgi:threonine/homoserine/homoserine lactone efflux protein